MIRILRLELNFDGFDLSSSPLLNMCNIRKTLKQRMNPVNGIGTTKDEEKAFQFSLNQLKGEIDYCYQHGIETTKDEVKAFQWYLKSAKGENNMGKNNLANCYHDGIGTTERS
ncbi:hypothetical protein Glove_177g37 [Diversispora epigaea]|uniref:Uncharacterized protein n=1 Tax=Diversispora epigaea TaxID=1348612 RepID=A0A397IRM6_9GLOM|nr:hypothetical protein Glove_177g37 [Diversispora epigaea]